MLSGIILCAVSATVARDFASTLETTLKATRSRYVLGQVNAAILCPSDNDGTDGSCVPIDLASTTPTFAYFHFFNITNAEAVNEGTANPVLEELGPFTCMSIPPYSEARVARISSTSKDDYEAATMAYTESLQCAYLVGGDSAVSLYDKGTDLVSTRTARQWVNELQANLLSGGDTVGTGGAPAFQGYPTHGNTSNPNNYMRRVVDDVPVLPIFPHAYLPDDDVKLASKIKEDTVLQWHLSSIGHTISFTWQYGLYMPDPISDSWIYARFAGFLPVGGVDLASRGSNLFDTAFSYHLCTEAGASSSLVLDTVSWVEGSSHECSEPAEGDLLSPDIFYLDVNLPLGIPSPIHDAHSVGGWEAWSTDAFPTAANPNTTATYGDANVAPLAYAWGFFGGTIPFPSMNSAAYNPFAAWGNGAQGKWLAEFGVTRAAKTLPAFAFSMMPKMLSLMSPQGAGSSFPTFIMGKNLEMRTEVLESVGVTAAGERSQLMDFFGHGALYTIPAYPHGLYTMYLYPGILCIVFSIIPVAAYGAYRMKKDVA